MTITTTGWLLPECTKKNASKIDILTQIINTKMKNITLGQD